MESSAFQQSGMVSFVFALLSSWNSAEHPFSSKALLPSALSTLVMELRPPCFPSQGEEIIPLI